MPWDSDGLTFTRDNGTQTGPTTWDDADAAGNNITTSQHDTHDQDLADGIEDCVSVVRLGNTSAVARGDALVGVKRTDTGSVGMTLHSWVEAQILNVKEFGVAGDGSDETTNIRAAVLAAETRGDCGLFFPPTSTGYKWSQVFIPTGTVRIYGNQTKVLQIHDATNSTEVNSGSGDYKVSAAFHIKSTATNVRISGFDFTSSGTFPTLGAGFGSYFPSIAVHKADTVTIDNNRFRSSNARGVFAEGGKALSIVNNKFEDNGATIHVGFEGNIYFYDSSTDTSKVYSPLGTIVQGNVFDGYSDTDPAVCLNVTGCDRFSVRDNKFINMNSSSIDALYIFCNDYGPHDEDGSAVARLSGSVAGNDIQGTFTRGIRISGKRGGVFTNTTWDNAFEMAVEFSGNSVNGTGIGIAIEQCKYTTLRGNKVKVSGSPLHHDEDIHTVTVDGNTFEDTGTGTNLTTIYFGTTNFAGTDYRFINNTVVGPTGDQYLMRATTNCDGFVCEGNTFRFNSTVASCRPLVMRLDNYVRIKNNRFIVNTDQSAVTCCVITGASTSEMHVNGNEVESSGTGATTLKFWNNTAADRVHMSGNNVPNLLIEDTVKTFLSNNHIKAGSSNATNTVGIDCTGLASRAFVFADNNYFEMPAALNAPVFKVTSNNDATNNTRTKFIGNVIVGNTSSADLVQQATHGNIDHIGNTSINAGAGGTAIGVTGSATANAL